MFAAHRRTHHFVPLSGRHKQALTTRNARVRHALKHKRKRWWRRRPAASKFGIWDNAWHRPSVHKRQNAARGTRPSHALAFVLGGRNYPGLSVCVCTHALTTRLCTFQRAQRGIYQLPSSSSTSNRKRTCEIPLYDSHKYHRQTVKINTNLHAHTEDKARRRANAVHVRRSAAYGADSSLIKLFIPGWPTTADVFGSLLLMSAPRLH